MTADAKTTPKSPTALVAVAIRTLDRISRPKRYDGNPRHRRARLRLIMIMAKLGLGGVSVVASFGIVIALLLATVPGMFTIFDNGAINLYWSRVAKGHNVMWPAHKKGDTATAYAAALDVLDAAGEVHVGGDLVEPYYRSALDVLLQISEQENDFALMGETAARAVKFDPNDSFAWYYLGRAFHGQGLLKKAEGALRQAHLMRPYSTQITALLAGLYTKQGRPDLAAGISRRHVETTYFALNSLKIRMILFLYGDSKNQDTQPQLIDITANNCDPTPVTATTEIEARRVVITLAPLASAEVRYSDIVATLPNGGSRRSSANADVEYGQPEGPNRMITDIPPQAPIGARPAITYNLGKTPLPVGTKLSFSLTVCPSRDLFRRAVKAGG